jgi:hypothetical protein
MAWAVLTAALGIALICRARAGNDEPRSWRISREPRGRAAIADRRRRIQLLETTTYSTRRDRERGQPPHTAGPSSTRGFSSQNSITGAGCRAETASQDHGHHTEGLALATASATHTASPDPTPAAAPATAVHNHTPTRWSLPALCACVRARFAPASHARRSSGGLRGDAVGSGSGSRSVAARRTMREARPEGSTAAASASGLAVIRREKTSSRERMSVCGSSTGGGRVGGEGGGPPVRESEDEEVCVLCLCPYEEGDLIRHLPCRHHYHAGCVDTWLEGGPSHTCPLCKADPFAAPPSSV